MDVIKIILEQFALLCCNSTFLWIILIAAVFGLNLFTMKGMSNRFARVRNADLKKYVRILCYLLLVIYMVFLPFLLADAIGYLILSELVVPIIIVVVPVLIVLSSPFLLLYFLYRYGPKILRRLWLTIGPYGERLLTFIETSPGLVPRRLNQFWRWLKANLLIWFNDHKYPQLLADPDVRDLLALFDISSETLLEHYAHSPYTSEEHNYQGVKGLGTLYAIENLIDLGLDTTASDLTRASAANQLEKLQDHLSAVKVWYAIGRTSTNPLRQLEACSHLVSLNANAPAVRILNNVLPVVNNMDPRYQLHTSYLHARIGNQDSTSPDIEQIALKAQDPSVGIKGAGYLIELNLVNEAQNVLIRIATDQEIAKRYRLDAIDCLRLNELDIGLVRLVAHQNLSAGLHFHVARALELRGQNSLAEAEYRRIANSTTADIEARINAVEAKLRYDRSNNVRDLLCNLAKQAGNNSLHRLKIAKLLHQGGWTKEAIRVLMELYEDPGTDPRYRRMAKDELMRIQ